MWWDCIHRPMRFSFKDQVLLISVLFTLLPESESLDFCFNASLEGNVNLSCILDIMTEIFLPFSRRYVTLICNKLHPELRRVI